MPKPERVTFFKASLTDQPGALLAVAQELKSKNLSLSGLWGYSVRDGRADLFVVPKNPEKLRAAWNATGRSFEEGTGFFLKGADRPGALVKALDALAEAGINITALHAIAVGGNFGSFLWVSPADVDRTVKALGTK
jgi:prephenate dehydratase